jgi:hypothetical protein
MQPLNIYDGRIVIHNQFLNKCNTDRVLFITRNKLSSLLFDEIRDKLLNILIDYMSCVE